MKLTFITRYLGRAWPRFLKVPIVLCLMALGIISEPVSSQRNRRAPSFAPNMPYDGRYTFVRVRYEMPLSGGYGRQGPPWSHDYPRGETHFTKIVSELSTTRVRTEQSNIISLSDPELYKYPIAYMAEPGYWQPNEAEVKGLHDYLLKGGFMIFDDFAGQHWMNFETQIRKVLPNARPIPLTLSHPIFDSFYRIKSLDYDHPYYPGMRSVFFGVFEDNDPSKRLMVIVNYNNDLSEYWEFSDEGMFPLDASNEAYKFGVNYIVYALTR